MQNFPLTLDHIRAWCDHRELKSVFNPEVGQLAFVAAPGAQPVRVWPHPKRNMVTLLQALPTLVPPERRSAVGEAIGLLNSSSFMGAWAMNSDKGEVYFRITLPIEGALWSDDGLAFITRVLIGTVSGLQPKLLAVSEGAAPQSVMVQSPG